MLLEQDAPKLGQRLRADIVERPEDSLTVFYGQRHNSSLESERLLKHGASRLTNEPYEFADIVVGDVQAREVQRSEPTRLVGDD